MLLKQIKNLVKESWTYQYRNDSKDGWSDDDDRRHEHRRKADKAFRIIIKHLIQTRTALKRGDVDKADKLLSGAINALSKMVTR
jgi:hypothetical protein